MSVHRDPRQGSLLSLAGWGEPADIAEAGPSVGELLRRRAQGEPLTQVAAAIAPGNDARTSPAPFAQVRSVPVRRERPVAAPVAAVPVVAAPARKGLFARVGAMLARGGDPRHDQADETSPAVAMQLAPDAVVPVLSAALEPAAPTSEADIMAGYFARLPTDAAGMAGSEQHAWPADAAPERALAPAPAMPVGHAVPAFPRQAYPAPPPPPFAPPHPAAPWLSSAIPTPASAHFYWPVAPAPAPAPAWPQPSPPAHWPDAATQPQPLAAFPPASAPEQRAIPGNAAARAELAAEIEAVRARLHDFAEMVERLRALRGTG